MLKLKYSHEKFIEYYLTEGNATEAYHKAYPSATRLTCAQNGDKLLRKANVQVAIAKGKEELAKKCMVTKEDLIADLLFIKNLHRDGNSNQSSTAIKAIDLLTKMLGFNAPVESTVIIKGEQPLFGD